MENNKRTFTMVLGVLVSTVFFYLFASGGSLLAGNWLFPSKDFGDNTYIGPYDVSDLKEAQTTKVLSDGVTDLEGRFDVDVQYQDASFKLPPEAVSFDVQGTIDGANSGAENPLVVHVKNESIRTLLDQNFGMLDFTDEEVAAVTRGIERRLRNGTMPANVQISDFLDASRAEGSEPVSEATFAGMPMTEGFRDALAAIEGYRIEAGSSVSFLQMMEDAHAGSLTQEEMTRLASLLYASILKTNFIIDERTISDRLPEGVPVGYEAAVNPLTEVDFMFTNPNSTSFTVSAGADGDAATLSINGLPFFYEYEIRVSGMENYKPRTIRQYSENVKTITPRIEEAGAAGIRATVLKQVYNGPFEERMEEVSTDFYPPVHRIEVHRLKPVQQPADAGDGNGGSSSADGGNSSGSSGGTGDGQDNAGSSGSGGNPGTGSGNGSGSGNDGTGSGSSSGSGNGSGGKNGGSGNSGSGNGSGQSGSGSNNGQSDSGNGSNDEVEYDKGGNPIKP
ncbi:VanW family protein [Edaphobacillus lindanitolerans]|uniref:VanW like protein n=1 Tax=Edaphobacillus lindanitolerans TaxID=550447 RepID=A0A1U7PN39_9BACI|nr:VanW family protein [Edaphobacillus lindanitolerans]SIT83251.1 VanW like protein [Edaphobacillus lindanitolerans]